MLEVVMKLGDLIGLRHQPDTDWEPMVTASLPLKSFLCATGRSTPLQMRRRIKGKYVYREPTQKEVEDFMEADAW